MPPSVSLFGPGTEEYDDATSTHNSSGSQHPALVARPRDAAEVGEFVREAARRGLRLLPQATGHGAGGVVGDDVIVLDTSGLDSLAIDPTSRTVVAGARLTRGEVNPAAERHGLLGLAGSWPTVGVGGYTFGGGIGWLCRPHGTAASALRSVQYVDGAGHLRRAADDAEDEVDREALFAFRGGGGVGVATALELDLVPVDDLHAGYLLWPAERLEAVVSAWSSTLPEAAVDVATSISVLHTPQAPPFPEELRGTAVVHLALSASLGAAGAAPLLAAVRAAAPPLVDTWGPSDAARLAQVHLDPPAATPAIGDARWLTGGTPDHAVDILSAARSDDTPVVLLEIRNVANQAPTRPGAATSVGGPFVVHAVAPLTTPGARSGIDAALGRLRDVVAPVDTGRRLGSWVEGATSVPDGLAPEVRLRVAAAADRVDPAGTIVRNRLLR